VDTEYLPLHGNHSAEQLILAEVARERVILKRTLIRAGIHVHPLTETETLVDLVHHLKLEL
jgi:hypothetical protein